MINQKLKKEFCRVNKCFEFINNSYEKWQLDLCFFHLIEFMKSFMKDEKINAIFDKFCEQWEKVKNTNQTKAKKKIKKKINELQIYFDNQEKLTNKFENLKRSGKNENY